MRALTLIVLASMSGCTLVSPCGSGECPQADPMRGGAFVAELPDDSSEADVTIANGQVAVVYTDADGNTWEVVYAAAQ